MNNSTIIKGIAFLLCSIWLSMPVYAQGQKSESSNADVSGKTPAQQQATAFFQKFKLSGFIQTQYQYGEAAADGVDFKLAKRANAYESNPYYPGSNDYKGLDGFSRLGVRMGRFKLTYDEGIASGVVQLDISEKGINDANVPGRNVVMFKDLYLQVKDPWFGTCALRTGIFDRPFGYEIAYSISFMEYPERSRITQTLFPDEKDLGVAVSLQPAKTSAWNFLKLEAGLFAGNGIKPQIDSHLDFIGHLSFAKTFGGNRSLSGGVSLYAGGVLQTDSSTFAMKDRIFALESKSRSNIGRLAMRQYIGFDLQYSTKTSLGTTQLRGEYLFGKHPGNASGAYNFNLNDIQGGPVYMRSISGGYVLLVQDLGRLPVSAVVKYDWYNPNTKISENAIGADQSKTGAGDIAMSNLGLGFFWRIHPTLKLTAYYNFISNETTTNLKDRKDGNNNLIGYGYERNRPDNVFTLRLQYRFSM